MLTGIFSYFHSEDVATNRLRSASGSVTVHEPKWDSEGQYMARASEPGMKIPKDPYGVNDGQVDLYIRLKMTVSLDPFKTDGKTETYKSEYNDNTGTEIINDTNKAAENSKRRMNGVLSAIKTSSDGNLFSWDGTGNIIDCLNDNFVMKTAEESGKTVYYFYYTGGDTDKKMCAVKPGEATAELFHQIDIPIYKKDYLGVFDQEYSITIQAEGIPVDGVPADYVDGLPVDNAADLF